MKSKLYYKDTSIINYKVTMNSKPYIIQLLNASQCALGLLLQRSDALP